MTNPCAAQPGWGSLSFGEGAWGGVTNSSALLPSYPPFDVFQLGPCGSFLTLPLYPEVTLEGDGQWSYVPATGGVQLQSGVVSTRRLPVSLRVVTLIPNCFTAEWTLVLTCIPATVNTSNYIHIGAGSAQGMAVGLALSKQGIGFAPSPGTTPRTVLPGTQGLLEEGKTYVIRLVATADATYVYVTEAVESATTGQVLRFVLDASPASLATDLAWVEVKGSTAAVDLQVLSKGVSSKILISNFPPVAVAGKDQAATYCSIVQLDGSGSYDNEGQTLTYHWRLIEAPTTSGFCLDGLVGSTYEASPLTQYTDKVYCTFLGSLAVGDIASGDVLVIQGQPYDILALGEDAHGDYVQLTTATLPLGTEGGFKVLRQFGVNQPTAVKATFYPDVPGFYRFSLVVSDGASFSAPSTTVVSVTSTVRAQGITPDASFLWEYLSNFWKLVDDKERHTVVWSSLMQFCAAELFNLWQYEYSKSLRDIQRTFQRRWLAYDLKYVVGGAQTLRTLLSPYDTFITDWLSTGLEDTQVTFTFSGGSTVVYFAAVPGGVGMLVAAEVLRKALPSCCTVTAMPVPGDAASAYIRISSTQPFRVTASTASLFPLSSEMTSGVHGTGGQVIWAGKGLQITGSFFGLGLQENDLFEAAGELHRVMAVDSSVGGHGDILVLKDPLVGDVPSTWSLPSYFRCTQGNFYEQLVTAGDDVVADIRSSTARGNYYHGVVTGVCAADTTVVGVDLSGLFAFLDGTFTLNVDAVYRRRYVPVADVVADVPTLQELVFECPEEQLLRRNLDFYVESFRGQRCLRFDPSIWVHESGSLLVADAYPPCTLWAETTYLDNTPAIENNFGTLVGFTAEDCQQLGTDTDYLSAVRGLWYARLNGARMDVLRVGAQVLLGLPLAEEEGYIEELRTDFSPTTGRILVRDADTVGAVRSYAFPKGLGMEVNPATKKVYQVGDKVQRFAPLVQGVEVVDAVSNPKWIDAYAVGGAAESLQRFFRFLIRVDHSAFNVSAVAFVRQFFLQVKPAYTQPIMVAQLPPQKDAMDVMDTLHWKIRTFIYDTPHSGRNYASCFDQPEDGGDGEGGLYKNAYDGVNQWSHDVTSPFDEAWLKVRCVYSAAFIPAVEDSVFGVANTVYNAVDPTTPVVWDHSTQLPAGTYFRKLQV